MQALFRQDEPLSGSGCSTSTPGSALVLSPSAMPGSAAPSKRTTSSGKLSGSQSGSPKRKSSRTSAAGSTSGEKAFVPYWNEVCRENSSRLWLPTQTDLQDSASNSSDGWSSATVAKSWFSASLRRAPRHKSSPTTCLPSSPSLPQECTGSANTVTKARLIKLYPTSDQAALLRQWMAASRWCYNQTIEFINNLKGPRPHWTQIKKAVVAAVPEWAKAVPFQVKAIAVKDACDAYSAQKIKAKRTGKPFRMSFRSRRNPTQSCFLPSSALKPKPNNAIGVYLKIAGIFRAAEPLPQQHRDSRLVWDQGIWVLAVPFSRPTSATGREPSPKSVALDPGVRTFQTFYSPIGCGKIGEQAQQRIVRLAVHLDGIISRRAKADKQGKRRLTLAAGRLRRKIRNLIDELHWKTIRFLLNEFDVVVIPPFSAKGMTRRSDRKLRNKSVRAMLGLSHSKFRARLTGKAKSENKIVLEQCEAYTSKTCSWSGEIIPNLGGRKRVVGSDNVSVDRDINGARGIFLRALVDTPLRLGNQTQACCS